MDDIVEQRRKSKEFWDSLVEIGARALCERHKKFRSPDEIVRVREMTNAAGQHCDMRKFPVYGDKPLWMTYRADAECVLNALFAKPTK